MPTTTTEPMAEAAMIVSLPARRRGAIVLMANQNK
jgi:hypothetical protein